MSPHKEFVNNAAWEFAGTVPDCSGSAAIRQHYLFHPFVFE
jgi:hypothetical protein